MPTPRLPARVLAPLAATALALGLAGCGAGHPGKHGQGPAGQDTRDGSRFQAVNPLTGQRLGRSPHHPVAVVKVDNTDNSDPQLGLKGADLVNEELVEGGETRLAAMFYSRTPQVVGPVRSMRASDMGIVTPAKALLICSGGAPPTVHRVKRQRISFLTGSPAYFRSSSRPAPYNLFVHLKRQLASVQRKSAGDIPPYLPWGGGSRGKDKAASMTVTFSPSHTTHWSYRHGGYRNLDSHASPSQQYRPSTVLVLRVQEGDAGYKDPAGNPVPETVYRGSGSFMMFHGGRMVRGTWSKPRLGSTVRLRTGKREVTVPRGHAWIELVPRDRFGGHVSWSRR